MTLAIPLSLYIHIPWCIRKCPYCDFNSHQLNEALDEKAYIEALLLDLQQDLARFPLQSRKLHSIFIGGGTPSLLSAASFDYLLNKLSKQLAFSEGMEITLEANPGTVEQQRFRDYRSAGINRISLGIQSFDDQQLQKLGRIHDSQAAHHAINTAYEAGFSNINIDLMYGLPSQSADAALEDLSLGLSYKTPHLSWYQLTLEANTVFYKHPPPLPNDDAIADIEEQGRELLHQHGYQHYEVSAYAQSQKRCEHNLNYWQFGDYIGIGAGAHGKITNLATGTIQRTQKVRQPKAYLHPEKAFLAQQQCLLPADISFEFMLNHLRLLQPVDFQLYSDRTGLAKASISKPLAYAEQQGLIEIQANSFCLTKLGQRFINSITELFLPDATKDKVY